MMKKLLFQASALVACLLFGNYLSKAQVTAANYGFSEGTGTYTAITGTTSSATGDDGTQNGISIGFTFDFAGTSYTTFSVSTNGFIKLGATITTGTPNYTNSIGAATNAPLLAPFWDDNNATGGNIRYETAGTAGSRVLTVQWTNIHIGNGGSSSTPTYSFQVKLYETSNLIEFIYSTASAAFVSTTAAVGITSASGVYLSVTPGTPSTVSNSTANNNISAAIPANTVYTFDPNPCTGTPNPGNTLASVSSACSGTNFTLYLQNNTAGSGVSYQWQTSPDGINWTNAGPNGPSFSTSQTATTYYQAIVTCTNTSSSGTSTPIMVGMNPFYNCYCTPISICVNEGIDSVAIDAFSNTSNFCVNSNGYTDYSSLGSVASVNQGGTLSVVVKAHINSNPASAGLWIDYDQNGQFDANEYTSLGSATVSIPTGGTTYIFANNVNVPLSALTGLTRMRTRTANQNGITNTSSCITSSAYGEFEDYLVTINQAPSCGTSVTAGTVTASEIQVGCPAMPFTLSATGFTAGVTNLSYQWEESMDGFTFTNLGAATSGYVPYNVTGIAQTMYYRLKVTCAAGGAYDISQPVQVIYSTPVLPWTEGFEGMTTTGANIFPPCWSRELISGTNPSTSTTNDGNRGPRTGTKYLHTQWSSNVWVFTPAFELQANTSYTFSFHMMNKTVTSPVSFTMDVAYGISPSAVDMTDTLEAAYVPTNNTYQLFSYIFTPATTGTYYFGIRSASPNSTPWYLSFDDFELQVTPQCPAPSALTASNLTSTSADLDWTENGAATQWKIEYGPKGFTPGSGTMATVTSKPYALGGLNPSTEYDYYVKSMCSATDSSTYGGPYSFYTTQIPVTTFPWIEDWETGGTEWTVLNGNQTNKWHVGTAVAGAGLQSAYISDDNGTTNNYNLNASSVVHLYRDISFPASAPAINLNFSWKGVAESCCDYMKVWLVPTSYVPTPGTQISSGSGGTQIGGNFNGQGQFVIANYTLSPSLAGTTVRLVFEWRNDGSLGPNPPVAIDNITISVANCMTPSTLTVANVTTSSADLGWTETGTATQWSIEYGPAGFTSGNGTIVHTSNNPYALTGLTANTNYSFYIRALCSSTDSSLLAGPLSFYTMQIPQSVFPYAQNFETGATDWTLSNGTQTNKWYVGAPGVHVGTGGLYISSDGGLTNGYNNGVASVIHIYRDLDLSSFSSNVPLTFNAHVVGESGWDYARIWMVPINYQPTPGVQITSGSGNTMLASIESLSDWTEYHLNIPATYTGGLARLIIEWKNDGSLGSAPVKLDDLTIGGFPLAIKLGDINATNAGNRNRVNWTTESEAKSDRFELERSADGRNFVKIADLNANGEASTYAYWDETPISGINYYRLKMMDAAGNSEYSKVVSATVKGKGSFNVVAYPNPVKNLLTLVAYGSKAETATITISDLTGKVVKTENMIKGFAEVNLEGLSQGLYLIKYSDGTHTYTVRVTKQ